MTKCLMLKTKDNRRFLTHEKNLPMLKEFVNTFGAEISLVEVDDPKLKKQILALKKLAPALCNQQESSDLPKMKVVKRLIPQYKRSRQDILKAATLIQKFIRNRLASGKPMSLKELKKKYQDKYQMTDACLCNHLSQIRKQLAEEGYIITKIGAGVYQAEVE